MQFMSTQNKMLFNTALVVALSVSGCASIGAPEQSSTLAAYEQLTLQADGTRSWRNTTTAKISNVRIDQQAIIFAPDVRINDEQKQTLRQTFSEALVKQFSEAGVRVVDSTFVSSETNVVTVRANITAVELASPTLNVVTTLLLFMPVSRGSISLEIEALSAKDNQRIAAIAFSGIAGVSDFGSAFDGVGHAKLQANIAATKFVALVTDGQKK